MQFDTLLDQAPELCSYHSCMFTADREWQFILNRPQGHFSPQCPFVVDVLFPPSVTGTKRAGDFWSSGLLCIVGKLAGGGPVAMAVWVGDRCTHYKCHPPHQLNWCKILRTWRKKSSEYTRLVANLVLVTVLIFWIKNN